MERQNNDLPVDIIMATYNGEKYLVEQIDSIITQTYDNWSLIISDDGSDDSTVEIIRSFEQIDERINLVNVNRQGGIVQNFSKALNYSKSPYVMFSDQDDVWHKDKISIMIQKIAELEGKHGNNIPILGFSDLCLVDSSGNIVHESFYRYNKLNPINNCDPRYLAWRSTVYGCTVIFNKALLKLAMPLPYNVPMHDQWFALLSACCGVVFYESRELIHYRQHSDNIVGGMGSGFLGKLISYKRLFNNTFTGAKKNINQLKCLYNRNIVSDVGVREIYKHNRIRKLFYIYSCVFPYWRERVFYSVLFCLAVIMSKGGDCRDGVTDCRV